MISMVVQLVIDMVRFMMFGIDDVQIVCGQYCIVVYLLVGFDFFNLFWCWVFQCSDFCLLVIVEYNIGIMICYVGSDGYCGRVVCLGDDICFVGVEFGVQDVVFDVSFSQFVGNYFRFFD